MLFRGSFRFSRTNIARFRYFLESLFHFSITLFYLLHFEHSPNANKLIPTNSVKTTFLARVSFISPKNASTLMECNAVQCNTAQCCIATARRTEFVNVWCLFSTKNPSTTKSKMHNNKIPQKNHHKK